MNSVALVACSKLKLEHPCPAVELYSRSALFKKASEYASANYGNWYILSAKYGLIYPNDLIEPYDVSLNKMKKAEREIWAQNVIEVIKQKIPIENTIYFHCGKLYRHPIIEMLERDGYKTEVPLEGLEIGEQLSFYTKRLSNAAYIHDKK